MKFTGIVLLVFIKIHLIENRMLPFNYVTYVPRLDKSTASPAYQSMDNIDNDKVLGLKMTYEDRDEDYDNDFEKTLAKNPCAVVVLSNVQNTAMQTLLRRYRYDSNGILIPSSVKYFIKLPQGRRKSPRLVPLNDKAFSPVGGFVRYYKEVPPIPHSW